MIEHHRYRGHDICLDLLRIGADQVRWVWRIDGCHFSKGASLQTSEDVARSEALSYAQIAIERIDRAQRREPAVH